MNNKDVFLYHQLKIARQTLSYSDLGAALMGGMTKQEAMKLLSIHGNSFEKAKYPKLMLEIPDSLDKWYMDHGWEKDYWKEIPVNWQTMPDGILKQYPITNEILEWRKSK